jgi:hypothetical protein
MVQTPQSQAIGNINGITSLVNNQIWPLWQSINGFLALMTGQGTAAKIATLQTCPLNSDGSVSVTPDGSPNTAHPLNPVAYPALTRTITPAQIAAMVSALGSIQANLAGAGAAMEPFVGQ